MKLAIKLFAILLLSFSFITCNSDDGGDSVITEEAGSVQLDFQNEFDGLGTIVLNQTTQTSANGQKHLFSALKYVVSNISLIKADGSEFRYHYNNPDKGAFIIDQQDALGGVVSVAMDSVAAGEYTKIRLALGIHQDAYLLGHEGQALFWTEAGDEGMSWSWAAGYIFIKLEGLYGTDAAEVQFNNHAGNMGDVSQNGTADLYREITLDLPETIHVNSNTPATIHIEADLNKFLSGETPLILDESNQNAMGSSQHLVDVTDNVAKMFRVDHVHN